MTCLGATHVHRKISFREPEPDRGGDRTSQQPTPIPLRIGVLWPGPAHGSYAVNQPATVHLPGTVTGCNLVLRPNFTHTGIAAGQAGFLGLRPENDLLGFRFREKLSQ